jgi:transaldolase
MISARASGLILLTARSSHREIKKLIDEDGVRGVTSNPAIFEKAITSSSDYDADIADTWSKLKPPKSCFLV